MYDKHTGNGAGVDISTNGTKFHAEGGEFYALLGFLPYLIYIVLWGARAVYKTIKGKKK